MITWHEWGRVPGSPLGSLQAPGFLVFQAPAPVSPFPFVLVCFDVAACPSPGIPSPSTLESSFLDLSVKASGNFLKSNIKLSAEKQISSLSLLNQRSLVVLRC